jgi:hypothetical protein
MNLAYIKTLDFGQNVKKCAEYQNGVSDIVYTIDCKALRAAEPNWTFFFIKIDLQDVNTHTSVPGSIKLFLVNQFFLRNTRCARGSR